MHNNMRTLNEQRLKSKLHLDSRLFVFPFRFQMKNTQHEIY